MPFITSRPIKQVIPVNMVRRDRAYPVKSRKSDPVSTAAAVASAIASTTPMLQVKNTVYLLVFLLDL